MTDTEMEARLEAIEGRLDTLEAFVQNDGKQCGTPPPGCPKTRDFIFPTASSCRYCLLSVLYLVADFAEFSVFGQSPPYQK